MAVNQTKILAENTAIGTLVGNFPATAADVAPHGTIGYNTTGKQNLKLFPILLPH